MSDRADHAEFQWAIRSVEQTCAIAYCQICSMERPGARAIAFRVTRGAISIQAADWLGFVGVGRSH